MMTDVHNESSMLRPSHRRAQRQRANARASLRRVSSTAADEIAALRQTQVSTELVTEGGPA